MDLSKSGVSSVVVLIGGRVGESALKAPRDADPTLCADAEDAWFTYEKKRTKEICYWIFPMSNETKWNCFVHKSNENSWAKYSFFAAACNYIINVMVCN